MTLSEQTSGNPGRDRSHKEIDEHIHKELSLYIFLFLVLPFYMSVDEQRGRGTEKKEE